MFYDRQSFTHWLGNSYRHDLLGDTPIYRVALKEDWSTVKKYYDSLIMISSFYWKITN